MSNRLGTLTGLIASALCLVVASASLAPARAQIGSDRYAAIVMDHRTGQVLVASSPDETRHPASLTKMMTLYMVFEALRDGQLSLGSAVPISEEAASRPPSKLGIPAGGSVTVEQAILSLVTKSANDIAAALGERLGGSEPRFAQMMTQRARSMGMTRTTFRNASGLPDLDQVTTARDMATLGRRLMLDFPDRYHYFGRTEARFRGLQLRSHNRMLTSYEGVDGIKTGYIRASGFNIVTSAVRDGRRVVGAVFGGSSWVERDQHMTALLDQSFDRLGVTPRTQIAQPAPLLLRSAQAATTAQRNPRAAATASRTAPQARSAAANRASRNAARQAPRAASRNAARQAPRTVSRQAARAPARTARPTAGAVRTATTRTAVTSRSAARTPVARPAAQTPRRAAAPARSRVVTRSALAPRARQQLAPPRRR